MNNTEAAIIAIRHQVKIRRQSWKVAEPVHWDKVYGIFLDELGHRGNLVEADDWEVVEPEPEPEPEPEYEERVIYQHVEHGPYIVGTPWRTAPQMITSVMSHPNFAGFVYELPDGSRLEGTDRCVLWWDVSGMTWRGSRGGLYCLLLRPKAVLFKKG